MFKTLVLLVTLVSASALAGELGQTTPGSEVPLVAAATGEGAQCSPKSTGSSARVSDESCGGGKKAKEVAKCGFDAFRERVICGDNAKKSSVDRCSFDTEGRHGTPGNSPLECTNQIKNFLCHDSMWSSLGLQDRIQRVIRKAAAQAPKDGLDYRALPCIMRRESVWFDPSIMTFGTCSITTTDQGLGQVTFKSGFKPIWDEGFRSQLPQFQKPPYTTDPRTLFNAMSMSVDLQFEIVDAILKQKMRAKPGDYQNGFTRYNGSDKAIEYGTMVNACYQCMQGKLPADNPTEKDIHTNVDECLDQTMAGNGTDFSFTRFVTEDCNHEKFDRWNYWLCRGVADPSTKGLDPVTHLPVEVKK